MILAAAQSKLLFNWFDVALVIVLAFGFWRGRKNGMSKEFLPVCTWLTIVFAAGLGHEALGSWFVSTGYVKRIFTGFNQKTAAYMSAYLIILIGVWLIFYFIKKYLKPKLEGSNAFGSGEYYLGMISGLIRFGCMITVALALLNAPCYSSEEIAAQKAYNNRWYGGGMKEFSGDFFPTVYETQAACFVNSLFGPFIKKSIGMLFINTLPLSKAPAINIK